MKITRTVVFTCFCSQRQGVLCGYTSYELGEVACGQETSFPPLLTFTFRYPSRLAGDNLLPSFPTRHVQG